MQTRRYYMEHLPRNNIAIYRLVMFLIAKCIFQAQSKLTGHLHEPSVSASINKSARLVHIFLG